MPKQQISQDLASTLEEYVETMTKLDFKAITYGLGIGRVHLTRNSQLPATNHLDLGLNGVQENRQERDDSHDPRFAQAKESLGLGRKAGPSLFFSWFLVHFIDVFVVTLLVLAVGTGLYAFWLKDVLVNPVKILSELPVSLLTLALTLIYGLYFVVFKTFGGLTIGQLLLDDGKIKKHDGKINGQLFVNKGKLK
jgi:hypothetical protein